MTEEQITREEAIKRLSTVQNEYNEYILDDDQVVKLVDSFLKDDKMKKRLAVMVDFLCKEHKREPIRHYKHVDVVEGIGSSRYFIHVKRDGDPYPHPLMDIYVRERHGETIDKVFKIAGEINKIYEQGYTEVDVEFPTGNILFANLFRTSSKEDYAFEMPEDLKYKSHYSINNDHGQQETMKKLSELHGLVYCQLSNTSASVYKVSDDKLIVTPAWAYYTDGKGIERDIPLPKHYEFLGSICCDVWRIEAIDQQNFDKGDTQPLDEYEHCKGKVNPGRWKVKNFHHFMDDEKFTDNMQLPVWCELTREAEKDESISI